MDADALIAHLEDEGQQLAHCAERRGLDAPIAGLDWNVRALLIHTGGVHRWARTVVGGGSREEVAAANARMGEAAPDGELFDWFRNEHRALVSVLRAAPADLDVFTFLAAESPRHFWARRQAHETAIHRADAEGSEAVFDRDFALDGIEEILAFGSRRGFTIPRDATMALHASDGPSRLLRFGGERTVLDKSDGPADATVTGTASELYLWLWNRPSGAQVRGDAEVAALWGRTVRISWS